MTLVSADTEIRFLLPGEHAEFLFDLRIAPPFHVNAHKVNQAELIPTKATFGSDLPAQIGPIGYPLARPWTDGTGDAPLWVYESEALSSVPNNFTVPVAVSNDAEPGRYTLTLTVSCQPCSDTECLPPVSVSAQVNVEIAPTL